MVHLATLWLPIVLCVVAVFFASSLIWMALPIHKNDYRKIGGAEAEVMSVVRSAGLGEGVYMFPACDPATLKDNAVAQERYKTGPWGTISVRAGPVSMGACLGMWLVNLAIVSVLVAYVASLAVPAGAGWVKVTQVVFTAALLAYGGSTLTDSIWKGRPWALLPGALFDAVVYAALTAAIFSWLWPGVPAA